MGRWFRFYDDVINDPKILKLPEGIRWAWVAILCVASKNQGSLPDNEDIALQLRVAPQKSASIIAALVSAGLLDRTEAGFAPHNWEGRQYKSDKSDPTAADRQKRYRENKRNDRNATVTVKRPDTEQKQITEPEEKEVPAVAARDPRGDLFSNGVETLKAISGKHDAACRAFIGRCLKEAADDAVAVLGAIQEAERLRVADAPSWIMGTLKAGSRSVVAKPLTEFQRKQQETNDVRANLRAAADGRAGGGTIDRLLPSDQRERSADLRGGTGANILRLSGVSGVASD